MISEQLKISDFVRRLVNEKNLSYRTVDARSGGLIKFSTVGDIINGNLTNLSLQNISGLAKGLGVTEQEIFDIARNRKPDVKKIADERFSKIADGYADIPEQERQNLEPLLLVIESAIERNTGSGNKAPGKMKSGRPAAKSKPKKIVTTLDGKSIPVIKGKESTDK